MNKGKIVQIIGPVVDIEFTGQLPAIYNALTVTYDMPGASKTTLTLEVQQHLGDNWIRSVAMSTTEGLKRGMEVTDTGEAIHRGGRAGRSEVGQEVSDSSFRAATGGPVHHAAGADDGHQGHRPDLPLLEGG